MPGAHAGSAQVFVAVLLYLAFLARLWHQLPPGDDLCDLAVCRAGLESGALNYCR